MGVFAPRQRQLTLLCGLQGDAAVGHDEPVLGLGVVGALVDVDVAHVLPVAFTFKC